MANSPADELLDAVGTTPNAPDTDNSGSDPASQLLQAIQKPDKESEQAANQNAAPENPALRGLGLGTRAGLRGLAAPFATGMDVGALPVNAGLIGYNALTGNNVPMVEFNQEVNKLIDKTGLPSPKTAGERLQGDISAGAVGALSGGGAANQLVGRIPAWLQGLSGATSGGAAGATREAGYGPIAQTVAGIIAGVAPGAGYNAVAPGALPSEVANTYKGAEEDFGIKTPTGVMTRGRNNLLTWAAGPADNAEMTSQVNKTMADVMGANDGGENNTTINQQSFMDAQKNNSAEYERLDAARGDVQLAHHLDDIGATVKEAAQPRFNKIQESLQSKLNDDGAISSSDLRELTGYGSKLRQYANSSNEDIAEPAQEIIGKLKQAWNEGATPEQRADLATVNNKYKIMQSFQKIANEAGTGNQVKNSAIRDVINKAYSSVNDYETPAKDVGNLLNTANPGTKYVGGGAAPTGALSRQIGNLEFGVGLLTDHTGIGSVLKGGPMLASKGASAIVNSSPYRNALMGGSALPAYKNYLMNSALPAASTASSGL